jgi:hypothetical protein
MDFKNPSPSPKGLSQMKIVTPPFVDVDATRSTFAQFAPHRCKCAYCRNFRAQWPQWIVDWSDTLCAMGIDPDKPNEIIDFGKTEAGRLYQVEWPFLIDLGATALTPPLSYTFQNSEVFFAPGGIPEPSFDSTGRRWSIRVQTSEARWVLDEPEPE